VLNELLEEIGMVGERIAVITNMKDGMGRIISDVVDFSNKIMAMRVPGAAK
jgi:hypothetical protein